MNNSTHVDPAERSAVMRLFYRDWRPTGLGRWVNRVQGWLSGLGLPPRFMAALECVAAHPAVHALSRWSSQPWTAITTWFRCSARSPIDAAVLLRAHACDIFGSDVLRASEYQLHIGCA